MILDKARRRAGLLDWAAHHLPMVGLGLLCALGVAVVGAGSAGDDADGNWHRERTLYPAPPAAPLAEFPAPLDWRTVRVRRGESLALLFTRLGLPQATLQAVQRTRHGRDLGTIKAGDRLDFAISGDRLQALHHRRSATDILAVRRRAPDALDFVSEQLALERIPRLSVGTIESSLFQAGADAGLDPNLIMDMAAIFGWDIDFALDIRAGDRFTVLYESVWLDGERIGSGDILAAEFVNRRRTFRAFRHLDGGGREHYYDPDGNSMRKAFLRAPLDFRRISSHFNLRRRHPVLNRIRAHKGTDYAAPSGTPVRATGDGRVIFAGRKGGFGNLIKIKHGEKYETRYAHLRRFARGIRRGAKVRQGQTIGYVGQTGLATGPHLHYEFYQDGAVRNPVRVKFPNSKPLAGGEKRRFLAAMAGLGAQLDRGRQPEFTGRPAVVASGTED